MLIIKLYYKHCHIPYKNHYIIPVPCPTFSTVLFCFSDCGVHGCGHMAWSCGYGGDSFLQSAVPPCKFTRRHKPDQNQRLHRRVNFKSQIALLYFIFFLFSCPITFLLLLYSPPCSRFAATPIIFLTDYYLCRLESFNVIRISISSL
jgi:hypothetical protein